jgi:hypothetical protein
VIIMSAEAQEKAKRAAGQSPTPFGAESNDKMQGGVILGPLMVEPSPMGNLGSEPVGGPTGGSGPKDPLGVLGLKKAGKVK